MKAPTKGMLQLDAIIQAVLIIPMILAYLGSLAGDGGWIILALMFQFLLGLFQLGSAAIRTIRHGSLFRRNYLLVGVGYAIVLISGGILIREMIYVSHALLIFLWIAGCIVIPTLMGCFYWMRTIQQARGKFEEPVGLNPKSELDLLPEDLNVEDRVIEEIILRQKQRIKK